MEKSKYLRLTIVYNVGNFIFILLNHYMMCKDKYVYLTPILIFDSILLVFSMIFQHSLGISLTLLDMLWNKQLIENISKLVRIIMVTIVGFMILFPYNMLLFLLIKQSPDCFEIYVICKVIYLNVFIIAIVLRQFKF